MKDILRNISISIIIGLLAVILGMKAILIFLGLVYLYICWVNPKRAFWVMYFIIIMLPINSNNIIITYFSTKIGKTSINVIQIMAILLGSIVLIKSKSLRKVNIKGLTNKAFILLVLLYGLYVYMGMSKGYDAFSDFKIYIIHIILFYITYKVIDVKEDIYKLMNITLSALTINSIWTLFMYLTHRWKIWGITYEGGRFGGNYLTLYVVTISYVLFSFYNKNKNFNKILAIISFGVSMIMMMLSQNRTNPILLLVSCILILLFTFNNGKSSRGIISKIVIFTGVIGGILYGTNILLNGESDFAERFTSVNNLVEDKNVKTRILTLEYYSKLIVKNPVGNGFGTRMPFVDSYGRFQYEEGYNVDNAYLNIGRKAGIITLIVYAYLVISPIFSLRKLYKKNKDKVYIAISISYIMLLGAASMITSQMIHAYAVSCFIWVFISYTNTLQIESK